MKGGVGAAGQRRDIPAPRFNMDDLLKYAVQNFLASPKREYFDTPHPFYNLVWNSEIRFLKICAKNPVQILFKFPRNPIC